METQQSKLSTYSFPHTVTALLQYYLLKWDTLLNIKNVSQKLLSRKISVSNQRQLLWSTSIPCVVRVCNPQYRSCSACILMPFMLHQLKHLNCKVKWQSIVVSTCFFSCVTRQGKQPWVLTDKTNKVASQQLQPVGSTQGKSLLD